MKHSIASSKSVALIGIDGYIIDVQAISTMGLPAFIIVGMPDKSLTEATDRIRPAFNYSGFKWPQTRITVNLSPASIPKFGSTFDLSIVASLLSIFNEVSDINKMKIEKTIHLGEVGIDGSVRPIRGILPAVICAKENGYENIIVANGNVKEASLIKNINTIGVSSIQELAKYYGNEKIKVQTFNNKVLPIQKYSETNLIDMKDIIGQSEAKIALEIAAAGRHNLLMTGPPGTGKSMLANAFCSILPELNIEDSIEVTKIHSVAGVFDSKNGLTTVPPFESPHHSATMPSIVGGGSGIAVPGAISRAHKGVLFLDEAAEFSTQVLQTLRQPLETKKIIIHRAKGIVKYPSDFQLLMATNPCPCGKWSKKGNKCTCSSLSRRRYFSKISGPLLDRMDLSINVPQVKLSKNYNNTESSEIIQKRIIHAKEKQKKRWANTVWKTNNEIPGSFLRKMSSSEIIQKLEKALNDDVLTMRGVDKVLRVAWTIADLTNLDKPTIDEVDVAIGLRVGM